MNYVVLDMEWNIPYTFKNLKRRKNFLRGEIIQIGAVKFDENFGIIDTFELKVIPKYYKKIEKNIADLTGLTDEDLQSGLPFCSAIRLFQGWCGDEFVFLTWGTEDIDILKSNIAIYKLNDEWIPKTYNIQVIYAAQVSKENRQCSLSKAVERLGEQDFKAHDALNDAKSTAFVCKHLDMEKGLAEYEKLEPSLKWNALDSLVSIKNYWKIGQALKDPNLTRFTCPFCGQKGNSTDFVAQKIGSKSIGIGCCENGHEFLIRLRFTKEANNKYSAIRLVYEMDETNQELYERKKKEAAESYELYLRYKSTSNLRRIRNK